MSDFVQVATTVTREDDARAIAQALVEGRLAACVQVLGPITSTYRWQGVVDQPRVAVPGQDPSALFGAG